MSRKRKNRERTPLYKYKQKLWKRRERGRILVGGWD